VRVTGFARGDARIVEQALRRSGILAEHGHAGVGRQLQLESAHRLRRAHVIGDLGDEGVDTAPIGRRDDEGQLRLAQLA
jgi:hypothetical protein